MRMYAPLLLVAAWLFAATPALVAQPKPTVPPSSSSASPSEIGGKSLAQWIKELRNPDPSVRENAIRTIPLFGSDSSDAVPEIVYVLSNDRDVSLRTNACIALISVEVREKDFSSVVRALAKRLSDDQQAIVRFHAALALGRFQEEAVEALPTLIHATRDLGSFEIRKAAVGSLGRAARDTKKGPDPRATTAVLAALKDPSAEVRLEAAMALGAMGVPDLGVKPTVLRTLQAHVLTDRDKPVVIWCHVASMAMDKVTEKELSTLTAFLKADDLRTRTHAARALGVMGGEAKASIPDLVGALKDKQPTAVAMVCWALGEIGRKADPGVTAINALKELSMGKNVDANVKAMATEALEKIKNPEKPKNPKDPKDFREPKKDK